MPSTDSIDKPIEEIVRICRDEFPNLSIRELATKCNISFHKVKNILSRDRKTNELNLNSKASYTLPNCKKENANSASLPYKIVDHLPNKGRGLFANRDIKFGELILNEKPLLERIQSDGGWNSLQKKYEELDESDQKKVFELHDAHSGPGNEKTLGGIMKTNGVSRGENSLDAVLCYTYSHMNHSCKPNCAAAWVVPHERVYALCDIKEGEELCISYAGLDVCTSDRKLNLLIGWGFDCQCVVCTQPEKERKESDKRRTTYGYLDKQIPSTGRENPEEALEMVEAALRILKEEFGDNGILPLTARHSYDGYQMSLRMGDLKSAKRWIKSSWGCRMIEGGETYDKTREELRFMKNPKSHPAWKMYLSDGK